jgi:hypothetical protein
MLVYTHKITPRLTYVFKHVFVRILNSEVSFTTKIEEFVAHNGLKMTYSKTPLGNEFFIRSHDLLFEQGINDVEISIVKWEDTFGFFNAGKKSSLKYDIFASSFYLISRYEEYLPHVQDEFERFPAHESLAYQNNFLESPIVDVWAYKLLTALQEKFPAQEFIKRECSYISTFSVNQALLFKHKGVVRTVGGFISDFFTLKLGKVWDRLMVLLNFSKDPFDTYDKIAALKKKYDMNVSLFFLIANYTTYDNNISITKNKFRLLIKSMSDYVGVGLNTSFFTMNDEELLKKEVKKMESIINTPVVKSRQHMLRIKLPETYQNLIDLEIMEDYSMGYPNQLGFRAGTCTPFYFYDLDFEIQTPLKIIPFSVTDRVLNSGLSLSPKQALEKVKTIFNSVKSVNGTFVTQFHNEMLSNYGEWEGWKHFYEEVVELTKK